MEKVLCLEFWVNFGLSMVVWLKSQKITKCSIFLRDLTCNIYIFNERPNGNLRDQIIYPHSKETMLANGKTDEDIKALLSEAQIGYFFEKENGLETVLSWNDALS